MEQLKVMMERVFGIPRTMDPEELADRVDMLETKVETNRLALAQHEADAERHVRNKGDRGQ